MLQVKQVLSLSVAVSQSFDNFNILERKLHLL